MSAIWGDTITNVLVNTGFTGIYRVGPGNLMNTIRPIMYLKLHLSPAPRLSQGTYWLSWSAVGTLSDTSTTGCPPKVLPGRINPSGQMGRGHSGNNVWGYVTNNGQNQGFDKIIIGSASVVASLATPTVNDHQSAFLSQNTPNPFNGSTNISFYIRQAGFAKLLVYSTTGQIVATLLNGETIAGQHTVIFNSDNLPAGVYYYQLSTVAGTESKQMLLVN